MRTLSALSAVWLASCGGTVVDPTAVRSRISSDLGNVLHESKAAIDLNLGTLPLTVLRGYLSSIPTLPTTDDSDPDAAITWLTDQLFSDAHYLGDGVYRFPAELVCGTGDTDCVARWDQAQVRIRVEDDDGLRFWVQVGAEHDEPIEITLRHDELAVTANLDDATHALAAIAPAFGIDASDAELAGAITADLTVLGTSHVRATLSFDQPIRIAGNGSKLTSAAGTVATLELSETLKASLALGQTTVHDASSNWDLDLPAATFDASRVGALGLQLDNVSLGQRATTISVAGVPGKTIDLQPHAGRSASIAISGDRPDEDVVNVQSQLEIVMTTDHAVLGDSAPTYDVSHLAMDGWITLTATSLAVVDGSFALTTDPDQYSFTATKGECVSMADASEHVVAACN